MAELSDVFYPAATVDNSILRCIWRITDDERCSRKEVILPKGTVEVIFNFSDTMYYSTSLQKTEVQLPAVFVNGINTHPVELMKTGRNNLLGIQLGSAGLKSLFKIPAYCFCNGVLDLYDLCPSLCALATQLAQEPQFCKQAEIIMHWITHEGLRNYCRGSLERVRFIRTLLSSPYVSVNSLSDTIGLSDRQLRRFTSEWFGLPAEALIGYNRYLTSLQLLHSSLHSLTQIGLEAGYYDQSHFIREFKSYTNLTPSQYRKANKGIPGHIYL